MTDHPLKYQRLNQYHPLNRAAKHQLDKTDAETNSQALLHLVALALWGLGKNVPVHPLKEADRAYLSEQVQQLPGLDPEKVLAWVVNNPAGPTVPEQTADLEQAIDGAATPELAAQRLLEAIASNLKQRLPTSE